MYVNQEADYLPFRPLRLLLMSMNRADSQNFNLVLGPLRKGGIGSCVSLVFTAANPARVSGDTGLRWIGHERLPESAGA